MIETQREISGNTLDHSATRTDLTDLNFYNQMPTIHKDCFILKDVRLKVGPSMHLCSLELVQTWNILVTRTVIHPDTDDDEIIFF